MLNNATLNREHLKCNVAVDFAVIPEFLQKNEDIEKLIEFYKDKCNVILYNGKIVFSSLPEHIKISDEISKAKIEEYKKSVFAHDFVLQNQKNVNAFLDIEVEKGKNTEEIFIVNIINGNIFLFNSLRAKANSNFVCFEKFISFNDSSLNLFRQLEIEKNTNINIVSMQKMKSDNSVFANYADVCEDADYTHSYINLSEGKVVNYENVLLQEKFSCGTVQTFTFANNTDYFSCLTEIVHGERNTKSFIKNFAFVNDEAKVISDGINVILKGKIKSNARQATKIYNLSPKASSVANPQLIIDDFDVKASHAAAVGNLDEQSIYYLMTRGIDSIQAKKMLIFGLVCDIMTNVPNGEQENVISLIEEKIKG